MSRAIAFLAGMGTGYLNADRQKKQDERQAKFDKITFDEAQARADDRTEGKANRDAIRTAAAPVKVEQAVDLPDNRDIGQPGETAPVPFYRAGARRFAEQGLADTEAAAQNTPQATRGRVYSALAQQDPVRADQYRASGVQADAAEATLAAATKQREQQEKVQDIVGTLAKGGMAAIPEIYSRYNDGKTATVVENPKGGFDVTQIGADGKPVGTTNFKTMEDFIAVSVAGMNPDLYMTQAQRKKELEQAQANNQREFGLREKTANASMANDQTRLTMERQRLGMEQTRMGLVKAAADAEAKIPPGAKLQFASYDKELNTIGAAIAKAQADDNFKPASPGAQALMARQAELITKSEQLLSPYLGKGGKSAAVADKFGVFADKTPTPPAAKATAEAPPQAPPGLGARAVDLARRGFAAVGEAGTNARAQGAQYEAITRRVREAAAGAAPLTTAEVAIARQFGIVPSR